MQIKGKVCVVTGGASGIGEATVRVLAAAGALVTILDVDGDRAQTLAREVGPAASAAALDITDEAAVQAFFGGLAALDILVNNAGIGFVGSLEETGFADWQRLFQVNVDGVYLCSKYALPLLLGSPHGQIVNIGSVAGLTVVKRRAAYCATKGAVVALTRQMAIDYAGRLRVNCICPGTIHSPFVEGYLERFHQHEKDEVRRQLHARQPIGRMGRPDEVAYMVLYVCSDEAEYCTGSILTIDGGWTAQ